MPLDLSRPTAALAGCRRQVLRRRRPLAALLAAVAVGSGLAAQADAPASTVAVVVAARDLPAGEVLDAADLETVAFRPGSVPADVVAAVPAATGRVLAGPLTRGGPLTAVDLVGPALTAGRDDLLATPVRLPDAAAVALLRVGDEIDLVATDPQDGDGDTVARGAVVLALPGGDDTGAATGLPGRLVVLGLSEGEVRPVADAVSRTVVTYTWSRR